MGENKLILATRSHAAAYRAMLAAMLAAPLGKPVRFHGDDALCLDAH